MTEAEENAAVAEIAQKLEQEAVAEFQQANPELGQALHEFVKENQTTAGRLAALDDVETLRTGNSPEFRANPMAPLPLSDLRERLELCARAGVTLYRDANIELHFDPDARKRNDPNGPEAGAIRERF